MDASRLMRTRLEERIGANRAWAAVLHRAPRFPLAVGLALVPGLALLAAAWLGPDALAKAVTDTRNVHDAFARFISAVATASAIAVSVAALTLRREIRGLGKQADRADDNEAFRRRVRARTRDDRAPLALGPFLAAGFEAAQEIAERARREAGPALNVRARGATLGEYLDGVHAAAGRAASRLRAAGRHPHRMATAALDFEEELTLHLARDFAGAEGVGEDVRERLDELHDLLRDLVHGANYAKTLDFQWGFSRMAQALTLTSLPAIVVSAGMVLAYGDGAVEALGRTGAAALVGAALSIALLPLASFASYVLRFVFLNEHTLPTDAFVLGPENPDIVREERRRPGRAGRPG